MFHQREWKNVELLFIHVCILGCYFFVNFACTAAAAAVSCSFVEEEIGARRPARVDDAKEKAGIWPARLTYQKP